MHKSAIAWLIAIPVVAIALLLVLANVLERIAEERGAGAVQPLRVIAAANLEPALTKIARAFEAEEKLAVGLSFGATGTLAAQIRAGLKADVFLAADRKSIDKLASEGLVVAGTDRVIVHGRLGLGASLVAGAEPVSLDDFQRVARGKRVAIANPETAPFGAAALEALEKSGLHDAVKDRLVIAENVGQLLNWLRRGDVDYAFIPDVTHTVGRISVRPVDPAIHAPIIQAGAVPTASPRPADAERFLAFLSGPRGRELFQGAGFTVPGP